MSFSSVSNGPNGSKSLSVPLGDFTIILSSRLHTKDTLTISCTCSRYRTCSSLLPGQPSMLIFNSRPDLPILLEMDSNEIIFFCQISGPKCKELPICTQALIAISHSNVISGVLFQRSIHSGLYSQKSTKYLVKNCEKRQFSIKVLIKKSQRFLENFQNLFIFAPTAQSFEGSLLSFSWPIEMIHQISMSLHFSIKSSRFSLKISRIFMPVSLLISIKAIFQLFFINFSLRYQNSQRISLNL